MIELLLQWILLAVTFWLVAAILPGMSVRSFGAAFFVAAIYAILNVLVGWLLYVVLGIASFGILFFVDFLRIWIIGAILLKITDALTSRLTIRGLGTLLLASALMAIVGAFGSRFIAALVN